MPDRGAARTKQSVELAGYRPKGLQPRPTPFSAGCVARTGTVSASVHFKQKSRQSFFNLTFSSLGAWPSAETTRDCHTPVTSTPAAGRDQRHCARNALFGLVIADCPGSGQCSRLLTPMLRSDSASDSAQVPGDIARRRKEPATASDQPPAERPNGPGAARPVSRNASKANALLGAVLRWFGCVTRFPQRKALL